MVSRLFFFSSFRHDGRDRATYVKIQQESEDASPNHLSACYRYRGGNVVVVKREFSLSIE